MASNTVATKFLAGFAGVLSVGNLLFGCVAMVGVEISFALSKVFHWVLKVFFPNLPPGEDPNRYCFSAFIVFPLSMAAGFFFFAWNRKMRAWLVSVLCIGQWGLVSLRAVHDCVTIHCTGTQRLAEVVVSAFRWPVVSSVVIAACACALYKMREEQTEQILLPEGI